MEASTAAIEQEVGALKRLVDEFSRYARMPEPSPEPVDFGEVVASVLSLYAGHAEMRWVTDVDASLGLVSVDREQMGVEEAVREGQERLVNAVEGIEGGRFPVQPAEPFRCRFCAYPSVCRKDYVGDV